jgi:hypothetical protein
LLVQQDNGVLPEHGLSEAGRRQAKLAGELLKAVSEEILQYRFTPILSTHTCCSFFDGFGSRRIVLQVEVVFSIHVEEPKEI